MAILSDTEAPARRLAPRRAIMFMACGALVTVAARALADGASGTATHTAARELEGRLIAPCCWTQTLDIHESPVADGLRAEIAMRLGRGDSAATIEDDLAARYGEKIRAVPRGEDPRVALPIIVGGAMGLAVIWLTWLGASWLRRARTEPQRAAEPSAEAKQYDEVLDDALSKLSDPR